MISLYDYAHPRQKIRGVCKKVSTRVWALQHGSSDSKVRKAVRNRHVRDGEETGSAGSFENAAKKRSPFFKQSFPNYLRREEVLRS